MVFFMAWALVGCGAPTTGEAQPPEIAYGQDVCDSSGMIISEPRFAAATLTSDGQTHKFDDIGAMFSYHKTRHDLKVRAWFVHDYHTQAWVRGETAFYVKSPQVRSPMGWGIAAFGDRAAAETLASRFGVKVMTMTEVQTALPSDMKHGS